MNTQEVFDLIEQIAATPGKNDKLALLKTGMADPLFKRVVCAAYNPRITYGMRDVPESSTEIAVVSMVHPEPWELLDKLSTRALSGDAARQAVVDIMSGMNLASREIFKRIILKDMRAGFSEGSINKVAPKSLPEYPYMRCSLPAKSDIGKWDWTVGHISQEKADGMFTNVDLDVGGVAALRTRQGQELPRSQFEALYADVERTLTQGTQSHGEMLVYRDGVLLPREDNNGYINELIQGGTLQPNEKVELHLWDQIPLSAVEEGVCKLPYRVRLKTLVAQLMRPNLLCLVETRIVWSRLEARSHFRDMLAAGKEGTIVSNGDSIWKDGTSKDKVKFKLTAQVDLKIVAIVPGRANTKNEGRPGSFTTVSSCGALQTDVTVKNEKLRAEVEADPGSFIGRILKLDFNLVMVNQAPKKHSLFLPRMSEGSYRIDKTEADSFEQVQAQYQAAIETA